MHVRATSNTGATPNDIPEAMLHVAVYAGVPRANQAFKIVKETTRKWRGGDYEARLSSANRARGPRASSSSATARWHPPALTPDYKTSVAALAENTRSSPARARSPRSPAPPSATATSAPSITT